MINYLLDYVSNTELDYIDNKIDKKIKELFILNKKEIINNLDYYKSLELNIFEIINKRPDLVINDYSLVKERMEKIKNIINKIDVEDYVLFGI